MISWLELTALLDSPIAFHRVFAEVGGGAIPGLFLSQAFYWTNRTKDPNGWFYKTQEDWHRETALIRSEQDRARRELKARRLLEEEKRGLPCKLYYRVNKVALLDSISALIRENQRNSQFVDSSKLDWGNQQTGLQNPANTTAKSSKQSICRDYTENTSETTSPKPPEEKKHAPAYEDSGSKEPTSSTLNESEEMADSLPGESKKVCLARDNKIVDTQGSAYKAEQKLKSRVGYKLPNYRTNTGMNGIKAEFVEWLQTSYMPSTAYWKDRKVEVIDAKKWVTNREEKGLQEEIEARYEQMIAKLAGRRPSQQPKQSPLTPEQEAWVAITKEIQSASEGAYADVTSHGDLWQVTSNIDGFSGLLHTVMARIPLSALPTRLKVWYPECYRNAKRKSPHLSLPAPLTHQDRAS